MATERNSDSTAQALSLDLLRTDGGTQMRAAIDKDVMFEYRDKWLAGVEFDPIDVFFDGKVYWLGDGFHRFYGGREAKRASIPCRVHQGTQRDAVLFACGANASHGLRRTNADKRLAVEALLNDKEWVKWSDNRIAEQAGVSPNFVNEVRRQLSSDDNSITPEARIGRDGKSYPARKPRRRSMAKPHTANGKPESPAPPERQPGEDPIDDPRHDPALPTDARGNALPDRPELRRAFKSRDLFKSCEASRNALWNSAFEIAKLLPDGPEFSAEVERHAKAMFDTLQRFTPELVCSNCNGGGCVKCNKRGYTTRQR